MDGIFRGITGTLQQTLVSVWDFISRFVQLDHQEADGLVVNIYGPTGARLAVISVMEVVRLLIKVFNTRGGEQQISHSHSAV